MNMLTCWLFTFLIGCMLFAPFLYLFFIKLLRQLQILSMLLRCTLGWSKYFLQIFFYHVLLFTFLHWSFLLKSSYKSMIFGGNSIFKNNLQAIHTIWTGFLCLTKHFISATFLLWCYSKYMKSIWQNLATDIQHSIPLSTKQPFFFF